MRTGPTIALALAIACSACKPMAGGGNGSGGKDSAREPVATISLASNGTDCSARWNGEAVTQEAILQRSVASLEEAVRAVGGVANLTEENLPFVRVEAPAAMAYPCLGTTLASLQRSGFAWVVLRPAGGGADARAAFFIPNDASPPPPVVPPPNVAIAAGRLAYNGAPADLAAIRAGLRASGSDEEPPPGPGSAEGPSPLTGAPPGGFTVEVARDVPFGELHALVRVVAEAGETATLYSCAGPEGPSWNRMPPC